MRVWILINEPKSLHEDTSYLVGRLAARAKLFHISALPEDAKAAPEPPGEVDVIFTRVRYRSADYFDDIAAKAARLGVPITNPPVAGLRAQDKRKLVEDFADLVPPSRIVADMEGFRAAYEAFGGDVIAKAPFGRHGKQVQRISCPADEGAAAALLAETTAGEIVVQPFMAGFAEGDRRIICVRGPDRRHRPVVGLTRVPPPGSWRCNISAGGTARVEDPTPEEAALAVEVAERSGLDIAALDFGWHEGRCYLIETNQNGGGYFEYDAGRRANSADAVARWVAQLAREGR